METWTHQAGFPLITLTKEGNEIVATQKRFLLSVKGSNESTLSHSKHNNKWYVPLTFVTNSDSGVINNVWLNLTESKLSIFGCTRNVILKW